MFSDVLDLLSTITAVAIVGLAAVGLLVYDLVSRELTHPPFLRRDKPVPGQLRLYGLGAAVVFVALVTLRFATVAG